jgi:hypothetical protein
MEMYGLSRRSVERTIRAAGGTVLAVDPDGAAGPAWLSYRYWVGR